MKKTYNCLFENTLSQQELEILTRETKEILFLETGISKVKLFTSNDLWNIQRQAKTRMNRRFM